jgi:hypothetical protein
LELGTAVELETFGFAPDAGVAVATSPAPGDQGKSILKFTRNGTPPRTVELPGGVLGLAVASDGTFAFVIVRTVDRKGLVRSVDLMRVDLKSARVGSGVSLPATAKGLSIGPGQGTLLVASKDEIRTFQLPPLSSGPLYRVLGDNVGVAPIANSTRVIVAQAARLVTADLAEAQSRDGLTLVDETPVPARLRTMMDGVGSLGSVALSDDGRAWCVHADAPPPPAPPPPALVPAPVLPPEPIPKPESAPPKESAPPPISVPAAPTVSEPAPAPAPPVPGALSGQIFGPALGAVAAVVVLGPDNVLREAARVRPDEHGRWEIRGLPEGAYRILAAGNGGRVLTCDPPFVTIRVISDQAVEVPGLKVLRAQ